MQRVLACSALPLLAGVIAAAGCGQAFLSVTTGSGDDAGGVDPSDSGRGDGAAGSKDDAGGGTSGDSGPEPCATSGVTRTCAGGLETCGPRENGGAVWGRCVPTDCSSAVVGKDEACIPAAIFTLGGAVPNETDTLPAHMVVLKHRYFIDRYEASVAEFTAWWNDGSPAKPHVGAIAYVSGKGDVLRWTAVDDARVITPGTGHDCTFGMTPRTPTASINCITQATALAYCMAQGKRLPTEAEWELAAAGPSGNAFPWGNDVPMPSDEAGCLRTIDLACTSGLHGSGYPFPRNTTVPGGDTDAAHGSLNNMAGNYAEWTLDLGPKSGAACATGMCWPEGTVDPWSSADQGAGVVVRGGSYESSLDHVRTRAREYVQATGNPPTVGVRCVRVEP